MKKFFVLFCIPAKAVEEWKKMVDEATRKEQSDKMMKGWQEWMTAHEKFVVDKGLPVGKTKRVTSEGIVDSKNDVNWYLVVEAESHEAAAEMFKNHPHLHIPASYVDVSDASRGGM